MLAIFSFKKYSTAFTSWLVVRSISLMRLASSSEKSATIASNAALVAALNAGTSVISGRLASACNQRTSTVTRAWIKPNSERKGRRASHLLA